MTASRRSSARSTARDPTASTAGTAARGRQPRPQRRLLGHTGPDRPGDRPLARGRGPIGWPSCRTRRSTGSTTSDPAVVDTIEGDVTDAGRAPRRPQHVLRRLQQHVRALRQPQGPAGHRDGDRPGGDRRAALPDRVGGRQPLRALLDPVRVRWGPVARVRPLCRTAPARDRGFRMASRRRSASRGRRPSTSRIRPPRRSRCRPSSWTSWISRRRSRRCRSTTSWRSPTGAAGALPPPGPGRGTRCRSLLDRHFGAGASRQFGDPIDALARWLGRRRSVERRARSTAYTGANDAIRATSR